MARIRTIKPEFPQSESMGSVSRESRLCFVLLWTLADDEGRLRGNSRMLASLLFPYDDDAPGLIDTWLSELEKENCIIRYKVGDATYVQICNWLIHQKIDKPSKSKVPPFEEGSRIVENPREASSLDQGSRIKDQGEELTSPPPMAAEPKKPAEPKQKTEFQLACRATWEAYCNAYRYRYGTDPLSNAKVFTQIQGVCKAMPYDEAPEVAAFYVTHNDAFYIRKAHDVGLLLTDASKLRTEWATGNRVTAAKARQMDSTSSMLDAAEQIKREMRGEK